MGTNLDIAYTMDVVSMLMLNPNHKHWEVVKGITKCLSSTWNQSLSFGSSEVMAI